MGLRPHPAGSVCNVQLAQRTYVAHILVPLLPPQHRQAVTNISNHQAAALRCMRAGMEDLAAVRMCML